jgi:CRP-like cAMP-binding protein
MEELTDKAAWRKKSAGIMAFRYLTPLELETIVGMASFLRYGPDELVVGEGELESHFYGILDGTVTVSVRDSSEAGDAKDVYMCSLGPGDAFGEAGLFMNVRRTASVRAAGTVTLIRLNRSDVSAFIRDQSAGGNKLLLVVIFGLLRKLRAANQELAYERKSDLDQADVDALLEDMLGK